jgi:ferric-dicitrate binding protein FerR (iron transport regulator)
MIPDKNYTGLIVRYLKNEITEPEKKKLFEWVYLDPQNEKLFYSLKDIWETSNYRQIVAMASTQEEWEKFSRLVIQMKSGNLSDNKLKIRRLYHVLQIAAIVVVTFLAGFLIQKYLPEKTEYTTVKVPYGAKSEVELPDGSKIWINSGSSLKYPAKPDDKEVFIYLNGEAFFDIVKNEKRKLNVQTTTINVQVLGTAFNVKSYDDDDLVETTLVRGRISITGKVGNRTIEPVVLKPNQQARLMKNKPEVVNGDLKGKAENQGIKSNVQAVSVREPFIKISGEIDIETVTCWKDNRMIFKSESFSELARKMERWYNVRIIIEDESLKRSAYTGVFEKETIEQAMNALSLSLPFSYRIEKNEIHIIKRK